MKQPIVKRATFVSQSAIVIGLLIIFVLALAPFWAGRADMRLMSELYLYLSLAILWNLMAGYAGLVSVGQQAYVGFGGYALFAFTIFLGLHPILAIISSGFVAGNSNISVERSLLRNWDVGSCGSFSPVFRTVWCIRWWIWFIASRSYSKANGSW